MFLFACDTILPGKVKYYGRVLKPILFMALVRKAADEKNTSEQSKQMSL
jgi:hypothetical protein